MNFVYTLLSKRKLQWFVDKNLVRGWDDPRFPTVRGILRRGLTLEALKKYILMQGASRNIILLEWDKLWTINKQIIDPVAPRYVGLNKEGLRKVVLDDGPAQPFEKEMPKHKKNPEVGTKMTSFSKVVLLDNEDAKVLTEGEEVRFIALRQCTHLSKGHFHGLGQCHHYQGAHGYHRSLGSKVAFGW